jgi:hypothetical protein
MLAQRVVSRRVQVIAMLITLAGALVAPAEDWLPAGIHREILAADDRFQFTVIVPTAAANGQQAPVLFVLPNRRSVGHRGLVDPKPWQAWSERRGILVVALDQGFTKDLERFDEPKRGAPAIATHLGGVIQEAGKRVNLHPVLRVAIANDSTTKLAWYFAEQQGQNLGGVLLNRPDPEPQSVVDRIPKHLAVFLLAGEIVDPGFARIPGCRGDLFEAGLTLVRAAYAKDTKDSDPIPQSICEFAVDHLFDLVSTTSPALTTEQRATNLLPVIERNRGLLQGKDRASFDQVNWMFSIPGLDKFRRAQPALASVSGEWLDLAISLTKADEAAKLVEAHEFLSAVSKRPQTRWADAERQRLVADELKRLRKIPAIKSEVAAADLLANTMSALEEDYTAAKRRIGLKQLEELVAKYPTTHAGKEAAKLLEALRKSLR